MIVEGEREIDAMAGHKVERLIATMRRQKKKKKKEKKHGKRARENLRR